MIEIVFEIVFSISGSILIMGIDTRSNLIFCNSCFDTLAKSYESVKWVSGLSTVFLKAVNNREFFIFLLPFSEKERYIEHRNKEEKYDIKISKRTKKRNQTRKATKTSSKNRNLKTPLKLITQFDKSNSSIL